MDGGKVKTVLWSDQSEDMFLEIVNNTLWSLKKRGLCLIVIGTVQKPACVVV